MFENEVVCHHCNVPYRLPSYSCADRDRHSKSQINSDELFVSEDAKLIFTLTKMDGKSRCDALGITDSMYSNRKGGNAKAKKWFNELSAILEKSQYPYKEEAIVKLNEIYKLMTDW